jgi:hypothetical protein
VEYRWKQELPLERRPRSGAGGLQQTAIAQLLRAAV